MKEIVEDLFKIYNSAIDSYNAKICQNINEKYTIIDKAMIAVYLYIKILSNLNIDDIDSKDVIVNYLLKQIIYGETGNLALKISEDANKEMYNKIIDELVYDKFEYKNRILKKLKYNYKKCENKEYLNLLEFCELVSEMYIYDKLIRRGNEEAKDVFNSLKNQLLNFKSSYNNIIKNEQINIINSIYKNDFQNTEYYNLIQIALKLRDVYRYSTLTTIVPENVLFHQYSMTIVNIIISEYMNMQGENIDIYTVVYKSLFHDFSEYKGNEIVAQIKLYNDETKKMFAEIEENDENNLKELLGNNIYALIANYKKGKEGYVADILDKILGIMKLWIEVGYMNNYTYIKSICSLYQERFEKFKNVDRIKELKNQKFLLELLKESYIFIKENMVNKDRYFLNQYFTEEEIKKFDIELELLKKDKKMMII